MKTGRCFDDICLIKGRCVISAEAILYAGTLRSYKRSTLFSSNGVEKQVISFFSAYSNISFQLSFVKESNFLKTSY